MASKEISNDCSSSAVSSDELLDELAGFLYDAYQEHKQRTSDKMETEKGQIAENEDDTNH